MNTTFDRVLLDTNIVIALFAQEPFLIQKINDVKEVYLSSIILGELYYGAQKSARAKENIERIGALAARITVLPCDDETASIYGRIKNQLRTKGKPLPENDIWIAATVLQHTLVLVTRDAHCQEIDQLDTISW